MARSIPEQQIHEIREATDIFDLVSGYVTLKKSGQNYFGLCPFHQEKTPSFSINPDKQIFHCFGCGVGGNVYTFIMQHEGVGFVDAVKFLAQRAGIQLDYEEPLDTGEAQKNEALYHANEFAAQKYQAFLFDRVGKKGLDYLKNRGLDVTDIKNFGLGYAPSGWDNLLNLAESAKINRDVLQQAGLVLKKDSGGYYDRFRDRIMFPIKNLSGKVVAFGGRILQAQDNSPKYLNSAESAIYDKSKILYGLFENRDEIRKLDQAIFVEGYMDVIGLVTNGVKNVVATSGTSLTEQQARLILRYTRHVTLVYDSDSAGSSAAMRGADILLQNGLAVTVVNLPEGHDPDSFIRNEGKNAFAGHIQSAKSLFEYKLERIAQRAPEDRNEEIRSLLFSLAKVRDGIQRSLLLMKASENLHISENILWAELETILNREKRNEANRSRMAQRLDDLSLVSKNSIVKRAVDDLIRILLHDWTLAEEVFDKLELPEENENEKLRILVFLKNRYKSGEHLNPDALVHQFDDVGLTSFVVQVLNENLQSMDLQRWAHDCINTIKKTRIQQQLNHIRSEMKEAQNQGLDVKELLQSCQKLEEEKQELSSIRDIA